MVCVGNRESNKKTTWNPLRLIGMGVQIVLGTPASIWNAIDRRALRTGDIDTFVLDEAHELLCEGYRYEIHDVIRYLRRNAQIVMISGTRPPLSADVEELIYKFMRCPVTASFSRSLSSSSAASTEVDYSQRRRLGGGEDENDDCGSSEQQEQPSLEGRQDEETDADDEGTSSDNEDKAVKKDEGAAAGSEGSNNTELTTTFECHEEVEEVRFLNFL
jgi:hypothetical protein